MADEKARPIASIALVPMQRIPRAAAETLVALLGPMAPHVCEEARLLQNAYPVP